MESFAPILLFVYNRPQHTARTLEALRRNLLAEESDLIVCSDGARNGADEVAVKEVRQLLQQIRGFRSVMVVERPQNWGLAQNIIEGVTDTVNRFGKVIVLEDDLLTSPYFLTFMNEALSLYADEKQVAHVQGCVGRLPGNVPDTFLIRFINSTGWGTWARAWKLFEPDGKKLLLQLEKQLLARTFDLNGAYPFTRMLRRQVSGEINSWAIRWNATLMTKGLLSLSAGRSLVQNIGYDDSGSNSGADNIFAIDLYEGVVPVRKIEPIEENKAMRKALERYYRWSNSKVNKVRVRLLRYLHRKETLEKK